MSYNILLGITGGIAAYKTASLASRLIQSGYDVHTVMTEAAREFISPLTFRSLTQNPVETEMFTPPSHHNVKHISLADRADLIVVAPATANFISRLARGMGDDLLSTVMLASRAPVILAPAMNVNMLNKKSVQENICLLEDRGYRIISSGDGYLACGVTGKGRMAEPAEIHAAIEEEIIPSDLQGRKLLITAGPTREDLDKVRFLSNYSSGKMGYALARKAAKRGAEVHLISGPTSLKSPLSCHITEVKSAREMYDRSLEIFPDVDAAVLAAAVADYRPERIESGKLKKQERDGLTVSFKENPDILKSLVANKNKDQLIVGFAAEAENVLDNARDKLNKKGADMLVANDISQKDEGFGSDHNSGYLLSSDEELKITRRSKEEMADIILDKLKEIF